MLRDVIEFKIDYDGTSKGQWFAREINSVVDNFDSVIDVYEDQLPNDPSSQFLSAIAAGDSTMLYKGNVDTVLTPNVITLTNKTSHAIKHYVQQTALVFYVDKSNTREVRICIEGLEELEVTTVDGGEVPIGFFKEGLLYYFVLTVDSNGNIQEAVVACVGDIDPDIIMTSRCDLLDKDLDTIMNLGICVQDEVGFIDDDKHYPIAVTGQLQTVPIGDDMVSQRYTTTTDRVYVRTYQDDVWSPWRRLGLRQHFYQGALDAMPTLRDNETPLEYGDTYYDTKLGKLLTYTPDGWKMPGTDGIYTGPSVANSSGTVGPPISRPNGDPLDCHDTHFDTAEGVVYEYDCRTGEWYLLNPNHIINEQYGLDFYHPKGGNIELPILVKDGVEPKEAINVSQFDMAYLKDGSRPATGNFDMGGFGLTNVTSFLAPDQDNTKTMSFDADSGRWYVGGSYDDENKIILQKDLKEVNPILPSITGHVYASPSSARSATWRENRVYGFKVATSRFPEIFSVVSSTNEDLNGGKFIRINRDGFFLVILNGELEAGGGGGLLTCKYATSTGGSVTNFLTYVSRIGNYRTKISTTLSTPLDIGLCIALRPLYDDCDIWEGGTSLTLIYLGKTD